MVDRGRARPVSGEIMTASTAAHDGFAATADVIDAEFIALPSDAGISAERNPQPAAAPMLETVPSLDGMGMLRQTVATPQKEASGRGGPLFWSLGVAVTFAAFWISGGHALFRQTTLFGASDPMTALSISGVTSRVDSTGLKPLLMVDGEAGNDGDQAAALPPLEIRVTGNDGHITRYGLGTSGRALAPGERFAFSSRLDVPRNGVTAVSVTFAQ